MSTQANEVAIDDTALGKKLPPRTDPPRELGYDQSDVPTEKANETPDVEPTVESVEKACED